MIAAGFVQVSFDNVVDMIRVRHRFMPASRTMNVFAFMPLALMLRSASARIGRVFRHDVLIYMVIVHMMQVSIVQVVSVIVMLHGHMATRATVLMFMRLMRLAIHFISPN